MPYCFSRSSVKFQGHPARKIIDFDPNWALPDCHSSSNTPMTTKWCTKLEVQKRCSIVFQCLSSNFKVTRGKESPIFTRIERFRTVTQVWIHWWLWNDGQSLMWYRRCALLYFKVIHQISRSQRTKKLQILTQNVCFQTATPVWFHPWLWNHAQSLMCYRRCALLFSKVIHQISKWHGTKNLQFWPKLTVYRQTVFTNGFEMMHKSWHIDEMLYCFTRSCIKF